MEDGLRKTLYHLQHCTHSQNYVIRLHTAVERFLSTSLRIAIGTLYKVGETKAIKFTLISGSQYFSCHIVTVIFVGELKQCHLE